jgi:prepilin-type N-terminal cleavage/methylation domain-containing protein
MFRRAPGFTLLEVLVALIIVGIVSALSAGKFHAIGVQQKVARAAQSAQNDLEFAFTLAARNRQPVRISWNSSKMQMAVTDRAGTTYFRRTPLGKDYGFSASNVTFSQSPIEVYPNGLANSTLTISITLESSSRTITMSRGGMVRIQ